MDQQLGLCTNSTINNYLNTANYYISIRDFEKCKLYLDSASFHEESLDYTVLAAIYSLYGDYYSFTLNDIEAHKNYYKAIELYEKAGIKKIQLSIYHNLAFSYIQKNDTENLKKISGTMYSLALTEGDSTDLINASCIKAFYYNCLYEKNKQIVYLDSAINYDNQAVTIFEHAKKLNIRPEDIAYNYINLASYLLKKDTYNPDLLTSYLNKAEELSNPVDTAMIINKNWVKGRIAFILGNTQEAEQIFKDQLSLMNQWLKGQELSMYVDLYEQLSDISIISQNYKEALLYEQKKNETLERIHDAQKYEIIRELQTKYEVERKEHEIARLTEANGFQKKINWLYIFICLLTLAASILIVRWLQSKRKATDSQLKLTQVEKNEAMLQIQLKEEQLKKVELEKYEALLDRHFKELQISGKDEELEKLKEEQSQLNVQINDYSVKVQEYEKRKLHKPSFGAHDSYHKSIIQDVYDLINKRLKNDPELKEYIERLYTLDDTFFQKLQDLSTEGLSALNLKHAICFYIDMDDSHIAECFSIQVRSVHIFRHRLKSKLQVGKEVDFNFFLKQMMS